MRPYKTDLARATLKTRSPVLGMREHWLLILCDGRRYIDQLRQMFGKDAIPLVIQLIAAGYLTVEVPYPLKAPAHQHTCPWAPPRPHHHTYRAARCWPPRSI